MKKNIMLKVVGKQYIDTEVIELSISTGGTIEQIPDGYIIRYCETDETGLSSHITLTVRELDGQYTVSMERTGENFGGLVVIPGKRNVSAYCFGEISLQMGVFGNSVDFEFDGKKGHLYMKYSIDINSTSTSDNETSIDIY